MVVRTHNGAELQGSVIIVILLLYLGGGLGRNIHYFLLFRAPIVSVHVDVSLSVCVTLYVYMWCCMHVLHVCVVYASVWMCTRMYMNRKKVLRLFFCSSLYFLSQTLIG